MSREKVSIFSTSYWLSIFSIFLFIFKSNLCSISLSPLILSFILSCLWMAALCSWRDVQVQWTHLFRLNGNWNRFLSPYVDFDDEIVSVLVDMYQGDVFSPVWLFLKSISKGMGNKLAVQYGGSNLAHTISTYRNQNIFSKSRDLLTTISRFYSNTFRYISQSPSLLFCTVFLWGVSDKQKQDSIDLHLGNLIPYDKKAKETQETEWETEVFSSLYKCHLLI
jgi:hypothetical protein